MGSLLTAKSTENIPFAQVGESIILTSLLASRGQLPGIPGLDLPGLPGQDLLPTSSLAGALPDFDTNGLAGFNFEPPAIPSGLASFPQLPRSSYRRTSSRWSSSQVPHPD